MNTRTIAKGIAFTAFITPLALVLASILACATPQKAKLLQQKKRLDFVNSHNVEEPYRQAILDQKIATGMSLDQVRAAWDISKPTSDDVTEYVSALGRVATWTVQPNPYGGLKYILTFRDGKLESWYSYE